MASLSMIGLIAGGVLFLYGALISPRKPWAILFGLALAFGGAYSGGVI